MKHSNLFFLVLIFSATLLAGCKKEKKTITKKTALDFKIRDDQAIRLGELKIYPILNQLKNQNDTLLVFAEAVKKRGFNIRKQIQGKGVFMLNSGSWNTLYFANKSADSGVLLLGDIAQDANKTFIAQKSLVIPSKKITEGSFLEIYGSEYSQTNSISLSPLFPCPPAPLRHLLFKRNQLATNWIEKALPLLGFPIGQNLNSMEINLFSEDKDDDIEIDRTPQEDIGELEDFLQRFMPIGQDEQATGCLVTYRDTILISYVFAQANLFQKEWPYLSTSIYLNQLMGYSPAEMSTYTPFINTETSATHIHQLWQQELVLPKDNAYRGEWDQTPFYLVWF